MTFDDWYETYERDGGELMLFNTIDLEAAYNAGMESLKAENEQLKEEITVAKQIAKDYLRDSFVADAKIADLQSKLSRYEGAVEFETLVYEGCGMAGGRVGTLWGAPVNMIGQRPCAGTSCGVKDK